MLQNHYCVAGLQHRRLYNDVMNFAAKQPTDDQTASRTTSLRRTRTRVRRAGIVIGALLTASVLAAACGGGPTSASNIAAAGGSSVSQENSLLAYTDCMRTHGEPNMPEPSVSGGSLHLAAPPGPGFDPNSPQFATANNACKHLLPTKGSSPDTGVVTEADQADYLKAAACMRSHGVLNFPDPTFRDNSVQFNATTPIDTSSSQYQSALAICVKLIPAGLPYSSTSSGS